jgi:uncharacterized membrane protein YtjA (UPF0391 family)
LSVVMFTTLAFKNEFRHRIGFRWCHGLGTAPTFILAKLFVETIAITCNRATLTQKDVLAMIRWALAFAILALIAGVLGFGGLAGDFASIARILLFVFLVLFVVALIFGRGGGVSV